MDCTNPVAGLKREDCNHMSNIGVGEQGVNADRNNGHIWVGNDGPNTFTFWNHAHVPVTLILWNGDQSWVNKFRPQVTWSLDPDQSVTVSVANGVSGSWSGLYEHKTRMEEGQVFNTWGEFTSGSDATVNISREPNMHGNSMNAKVSSGCVADMNQCSFHCKTLDRCGKAGEYDLINCSGPYRAYGIDPWGQPSGGCQGWSNGGHIDVEFLP
jgi:hypothetical protein